MWRELLFQAARYRQGVARARELIAIADEALARGFASAGLQALAASGGRRIAVVGPLFEAALGELGIEVPSEEDACWIIARSHLRRLLDNEVRAYEAVSAIMREIYWPYEETGTPPSGPCIAEVQEFAWAWYALDGILDPGDVSEEEAQEAHRAFTESVLAAARTWLARHPGTSRFPP